MSEKLTDDEIRTITHGRPDMLQSVFGLDPGEQIATGRVARARLIEVLQSLPPEVDEVVAGSSGDVEFYSKGKEWGFLEFPDILHQWTEAELNYDSTVVPEPDQI